MRKYFLLICILFFSACDSTSERNKELAKDIEWEIQNQEIISRSINNVSVELESIFARSLQYRFPNVLPLDSGRIPMSDKGVPYLQAIEFKFASTQKVEITFSYKSTEKLKPHFCLFLFSNDGVNIFRHTIDDSGLFSRSLKPNEEKEEVKKIVLSSTKLPHYFMVQDVKE